MIFHKRQSSMRGGWGKGMGQNDALSSIVQLLFMNSNNSYLPSIKDTTFNLRLDLFRCIFMHEVHKCMPSCYRLTIEIRFQWSKNCGLLSCKRGCFPQRVSFITNASVYTNVVLKKVVFYRRGLPKQGLLYTHTTYVHIPPKNVYVLTIGQTANTVTRSTCMGYDKR